MDISLTHNTQAPSDVPPPLQKSTPWDHWHRDVKSELFYKRSPKELEIGHKVQVLLCKGAIELIDPQVHPGGFFSIYFLVTKKDDGFQPILELRNLNNFLKFLPFRMLHTAYV